MVATERSDLEYRTPDGDAGMKVREVLRRRLFVSARLLRRLKNGDGGVTRNGAPVRMNETVSAGDALAVRFPKEASAFEPEDIPIRVLYEDADILVVDKQAGLVVHPTKGHPGHTIANGLMKRMTDAGESYKIRFVNRLDMDTTGVLLVGKNAYAQEDFARQAAERRTEKRYTAFLAGAPPDDEGIVDLPIEREREDGVRRVVRADGFPSRTRYRVEEHFSGGFTRVTLRLETGRTHQIRVHMAHLGCPVIGDALYGEPDARLIGRQALHAAELAFDHPRAHTRMRLAAPLPADMARLEATLRRGETTDGATVRV